MPKDDSDALETLGFAKEPIGWPWDFHLFGMLGDPKCSDFPWDLHGIYHLVMTNTWKIHPFLRTVGKPYICKPSIAMVILTMANCECHNQRVIPGPIHGTTVAPQDVSFPQRSQLRFECARLLRFARFVDLLIAETLVTRPWRS